MQAVETLGGITPMYLAAAVTDVNLCSFPSGSVTMTGTVGLGMVVTIHLCAAVGAVVVFPQ